MILFFMLSLYSLSASNLNEKSFLTDKTNEYEIEIESQIYENPLQKNEFDPPIIWIVVAVIICIVFVVIIIISIRSCIKHHQNKKVDNSNEVKQNEDSSMASHYPNQQIYQQDFQQQQIYQQNLQQQILQQQMIQQQHNFQQQQIYQQNLQQQQQFFQNYQ